MTVKSLLTILLGEVLLNNIVLQRFLGVTPFLGAADKECKALRMSIAVAAVMVLTAVITWPVQALLNVLNAAYLQILVFVAVILAVCGLAELAAKKLFKSSLGVYFPVIALNSAVLGLAVTNISAGYNFVEALVAAVGAGLGFMLATVLFNGVESKINERYVPKAFRGLPVSLLAAAIISLALYAF